MKKIFGFVLIIFFVFGFALVKAETCPFNQEIEIGTKSDVVTKLQAFMKDVLRIYEGPVTGYFGTMTSAAIKVFQKNSGLLELGKVDLVTGTLLCRVYDSYNISKNISLTSATESKECFIKTLGLQRGYFEKETQEVADLQKYLFQRGFYPENIISGYFGQLTEVALKRFQASNNLATSGIIDDVTFKAICGYESSQTLKCPFVTNNLAIGSFEEMSNEVKTLQMILVKLNLLSAQHQTGFFGKLTEEAVKKFQQKINLPQIGVLTLETRSALCEMLNLPLEGKPSQSQNPKESLDSKVDIAISGNSIPVEVINVGTKVPIIVRAKNIGTEESGKFKSAIYINDKIDASVETFSIKPNEEAIVIAHSWTCEQKGIYALKIFLDNDNQLIEKNKFNNVLVVPINCGNVKQEDFKYSCDMTKYQCVASEKGTMLKEECEKTCKKESEQKELPDLMVVEFKPNKSVIKVAEKIIITLVEKNIGKAIAEVHQVLIQINDQKHFANWPVLDVGKENRNETLEWICPAPGIYRFVFTTNSDNKIKEIDYTNNSRSFEIACTDAQGRIPEPEKDDQRDQQDKTPPPPDREKPPTPPVERGSDEGSDPAGPPEDSTVDIPKGGRCGAIDNLNVGASICTQIAGRNNKANSLPGDISYFTLYPLDTINCVDKKNPITGRCDCCNFYRASPHRAEIVIGGFDCDNGKLDCAIDFGDGSPIEKWTTADRVYIDDGNEKSSTWTTMKVHYYKISDDKEYEIFCPKLIVNGQKYNLNNPFINDYEDKTKCIIVFRPNFASSPYHPGTVPWADYIPKRISADTRIGQENPPCPRTAHFFGDLRATAVGNLVTLDIWLNVIGGDSYLKKCPAVCVISWGDGSKEQVLPCWMKNSITHVYKNPGTYKIEVTLNSFYDYSPHDNCIQKSTSVVVGAKTDPAKDIPDDDNSNDIKLSCKIDGKLVEVLSQNAWTVNMTASIGDKKGCQDFVYSWKDYYSNDKWISSGKENTRGFSTLPQANKDLKITTNVRALCATNNKIYGTATCEQVLKEESPQSVVIDPSDSIAPLSKNWFTNLITNIFGDKKSDLSVTPNEIKLQSEPKYSCVNGSCVEVSTGGVSLSECLKTCFSATFLNPFQDLQVQTKTDSKPTATFDLNNNWFGSGSLDFNNVTISQKRYSCGSNGCYEDSKGIYTSESSCKSNCHIFNFNTLNYSFNFNNLSYQDSQVTRYKCNYSTGKCIIANNLDKNTYSSETECNKNCSVYTTTNTFNQFNNFNFQVNQ